MTTEYITLDVWGTESIKVKANQREVNSRFLEVQFIDKNEALNLENKQVFFLAKRPDGEIIFDCCEIINEETGKINLVLTSQMSAVAGIMKDCEFDIISQDLSKLKVKGLILEIEKCTDFDSETESTSEFTALEEAMAGYERASDAIDAHIADKNNPHEVTATQVGAAQSIHTHSTNDITSGTLPINMGGTGSTTASDALTNLGAVKFSNVVQQKIYIPNQPLVVANSFKSISLSNPFRGNTTDKILGITSYDISGRYSPDATGNRYVMCLASGCPFNTSSYSGSILVYNGHSSDLYVTTDSYIVVTSLKP